jgi:hypothetical protein
VNFAFRSCKHVGVAKDYIVRRRIVRWRNSEWTLGRVCPVEIYNSYELKMDACKRPLWPVTLN